MKKKFVIGCAGVLGVLVFCFILAVPAAPLWARLGIPVFCIEGAFPNLKIVACPQDQAVAPLPAPSLDGQAPIPVIVDDDGSPDGTIALLYFLSHPLYDVRAVTISYGEAHPAVFAGHILQLLAGLGRADIPVGAGRDAPLAGENAFPEPWRQGSDVFWDIPFPRAAPSADGPVPAAELIVDTLTNSTTPVMVFVSGSHTNLAEALRLEPGIATKIRGVHIMGGAVRIPGNIHSDWPEIDNQAAEWNIWVDPLAAQEVFASGLPLHLTPLDATRQVVWTQPDLPGWTASGAPEGARAGEILQWMLDSWSPDGMYIWDLVAAVHATDPAFCPEEPFAIDVNLAPGPQQGGLLITDRSPNISACLDPDGGNIKARVAGIFGNPAR
jgi:purine nucleosidase/pyrimidine-specific ribonucleoside hydrolase